MVVAAFIFMNAPLPEALALGPQIVTPWDSIPEFCVNPTKTSVASGSWSNPAIWSGNVLPTASDIVVIDSGHTVTFDSNAGAADCLGIKGTLAFRTDINTSIQVGTILVHDTGHLIVGTTSSPINPSVTAEIVIANKPLDLANDPGQYGTGLIVLGEVKMMGTIKDPTFIRLASEPVAGQTALTLSQASNGWKVGDRIVIPDSIQFKRAAGTAYVGKWEEGTILSTNGMTLTLASPLAYFHPGARDGNGILDSGFMPHVGNLTRNVIIRSENPAGTRGHALFTYRATVDIRYVDFKDFGRTTFDPLNAVSNHIGRYPLHAHHLMGPVTTPSNNYQFTFLGNAIDGGSAASRSKWGIAIHDSHFGLIQDNVVYNQGGGGIVTEDGSETGNVFAHNFVARTSGAGGRGDERQYVDLGYSGDSFWFRGPNNYVRDNVAADSVTAYGYNYWFTYAGNVKIPKFQGADTSNSANYTLRDASTLPLLQFEGNEYYGGAGNVMTAWWLCSQYHTPVAGCVSTIKNMKSWNYPYVGFYGYPLANLIFDGWSARDDRTVLTNSNENTISIWFGDYKASNVIIRNADIQGFATGILGPPFQNENFTIENSFFHNAQNIVIWSPGAPGSGPDGRLMKNRTTILRNNKFENVTNSVAFPKTSITMRYSTQQGSAGLSQLDEVYVYDYNQISGNNFRLYYTQQAPSFIIPQTQNLVLNSVPTSAWLAGCPASGLTNQQCFSQYGVAIAAAVAPCLDQTTRPEVAGFTCAMTGTPLYPTPSLSGLTVTIAATDPTAAESSGNNGIFTITRTGSTTSALSVNYTVSGTATNGTDYSTIGSSVTIPAGSFSMLANVNVIDDTNAESSETVIVTLSANASYTVGSPSAATVTIIDNDTALDTTAPSVPANLSASVVSSNQINLSWNASTDNVGVTGYKVFRNGIQVGTSTSASYSNSGLAASTTYSYTVSASDAAGNNSAQSTSVSAKTNAAADTTAPSVSVSAPSNGLTVSGSAVSVSATATDNVGVAGVQFKLDGVNLGSEDTTSPYSISWNTTTASNGTHTITAAARDAANNTTTSSAVSITVSNLGSATLNLAVAPSSITAGSSAILSWAATNVLSCTASGAWSGGKSNAGSQSASPTTTSTYILTCPATNAASVTKSVTVTVVDTTVPSVPTNLVASVVSSSQINLSWGASTDNVGVSGYKIFRGGTQVGTSTSAAYSNSGLTASTAYSYTVSASDAAGNHSAQSTSVSATTSAAGSSFDFSLSNSGNLTVQAGASATDTISATLSSGSHSRPVALSASGMPAGATASFATSKCKPNCATVLTIKTPTSTPAGSYLVTVTARGGDVRRTTTFTLTVRAPPGSVPPPSSFDFSLANGGTMTLAPGRSGVTMITATRVNGTAQPITLSAAGFPIGVTSSFSQRTCAPTCYSTLSMTTTASVPAGNYPIAVTARSEGLSHSTTFILTVNNATADTTPPTVSMNSATVGGSSVRVPR